MTKVFWILQKFISITNKIVKVSKKIGKHLLMTKDLIPMKIVVIIKNIWIKIVKFKIVIIVKKDYNNKKILRLII